MGDGQDERLVTLVHDLRTPLTIVQGFAELLVRKGPELSEAQRAEYITRIADGASELKTILDRERAERIGGGA